MLRTAGPKQGLCSIEKMVSVNSVVNYDLNNSHSMVDVICNYALHVVMGVFVKKQQVHGLF